MTAIFPLAVWQPGTLQPSTPVNDNALRVEVLQRGALSILSTPPGSPADGDVHIVGASPTGAWSTFAQNDVVLWRSGTWYRFAPFTGWLKQVGSDVRRYSGAAWEVVTGGGAVPIQDEGTTVVATPTAINFVGAGVTVTSSGGVATATIPGGGGGGGGGNNLLLMQAVRRSAGNFPLFDMPEANLSGNNIDENNYIFFPFTVWREIVATQLGIYVNGSASGAARVGIYANTFSGGNDQPGSRLVQTADIDTSGSSDTLQLASASITLSPGTLYWAAFVKRGGASVAVRNSAHAVLGRDAFNSLYTALSASATGWTELPSTAPTVSPVTFVGWRFHVFFRE